jgi:hypothetical protein
MIGLTQRDAAQDCPDGAQAARHSKLLSVDIARL